MKAPIWYKVIAGVLLLFLPGTFIIGYWLLGEASHRLDSALISAAALVAVGASLAAMVGLWRGQTRAVLPFRVWGIAFLATCLGLALEAGIRGNIAVPIKMFLVCILVVALQWYVHSQLRTDHAA